MVKRVVSGFVILILISGVSFFTLSKSTKTRHIPSALNTNNNKKQSVIIIDAGHGGFDGGAVAGDGTIEKDLNLAVALKLDCVLRVFGFDTVLVRNQDLSMEDDNVTGSKKVSDIKNRLKLMEKYDGAIFISIHMNKYSTSQPNGTQVFYGVAPNSQELASSIQTAVKNTIQKSNHRTVKKTTNDIYLLYHATVPAVIVECGFLSNPNDLQNLKSEKYQKAISLAIATGICDYYKIEDSI